MQGVVLNACLLSKEDHGYIIDLGISNTSGFLSHEDAKPLLQKVHRFILSNFCDVYFVAQLQRDTLFVGEPLLVSVISTSGGRVFRVTADPLQV